jgi:DNA (cytosine-5)-methyltransferase 1
MLFTKSRRAQSVDDYETWVESDVTNTLNTFDLGDIRTTTLIIFYGNRVADIRIQGDVINTLQARMGTGGNNMPILAYAFQLNGDRDNPGVSVSEDQAFTIPANPMSDRGQSVAYSEPMRVRRLTPTECERLQGFPDGWTDEQSDTQRYKQMGNAVTVNVIEWIGSRL